jgi:hypothetical protein
MSELISRLYILACRSRKPSPSPLPEGEGHSNLSSGFALPVPLLQFHSPARIEILEQIIHLHSEIEKTFACLMESLAGRRIPK